METPTLYLNFDKSLYRLPAEKIEYSSDIDPDRIISGSSVSFIGQSIGVLQAGKLTFSNDETGYILGIDEGTPKFYIGTSTNYLNFDGSSVTIYPSLTVGSLHIPDENTTDSSFHVDTAGNAWWGCTHDDFTSDNDNAVAYVLKTGVAKFQNALITGAGCDFINDTLDTSSKKILSDFNFGTTDYAGAVKSGDIAWNSTTGAITGGSGVVVYRGGIVGAAAGVATFTIDATTGNATFAGALSAATGTLGTITTALITLGSTGYIKGGQTAFDTGDQGFWFGYVGGAWKFSMAATANQRLTMDASGITIEGVQNAVAGDVLILSEDSEITGLGGVYSAIRKSATLYFGGTVRIKFDIKSSHNGHSFCGKIYRGGSPVGTEFCTTSTTYSTKSEDISGWSPADVIGLYNKSEAGYTGSMRNFRIYVYQYKGGVTWSQ